MTVLAAQSITQLVLEHKLKIEPYIGMSKQTMGMSYGLSAAGYDLRVGKIDRFLPSKQGPKTNAPSYLVRPGEFILLSSYERVQLPDNLIAFVHDKSTLARKGLALQNTVIEPGWGGFITLELSNHSNEAYLIKVGQPIAQLVFHQLDQPTEIPYTGKYQNQGSEPTPAIFVPDGLDLPPND